MRKFGHIGVALALATAFGCGYDMPASPITPEPTPSTTASSIRLTASSRTDQKIDVTATVLTSEGRFVANVPLTFSVDAGTITPNSAVTDSNGAARATASTPSATTLHVTAAGLSAQTSLPASVQTSTTDTVILNVPGAGTTGNTVTMFISSTGSGPWSWTFGDGGTTQTSGLSTTHVYGRAGAYTVTVTGPTGTFSSGNITISDPAPTPPTPTPAASASVECTPATHGTASGCHVTMSAADGSSLTSQISNVQWDWGDGNPAMAGGAVATHIYTIAGTFPVIATVTAAGQTATAQTTIKVP